MDLQLVTIMVVEHLELRMILQSLYRYRIYIYIYIMCDDYDDDNNDDFDNNEDCDND